ncbi:hypothetical protein QF049_001094 [Paenibacillus sp. W4I10]|uniref:hypothetical protein n=1 Tax=Paenibacillus sp. W4I10 TaxID=3042298 RepID=UPI00278B2C99|nr:hypothetical protein [Paenibacillus sp. W4I10]MDQ0719833.1 hypothetical protein [Paenibacillus sp. W4I10]
MRNYRERLILMAGCISLSVALTGCGESSNENIETEKVTEATTSVSEPAVEEDNTSKENSNADITESPAVSKPLITKNGGFGDTKEVIEQLRGADENGEDATFSSYQNNKLLVLYSEDEATKNKTAFNVTLQFESTDIPRLSKKEALREASLVIPNDSIKVKEYKADEDRDVIQYESKLLAERLKSFYDLQKDDPEYKPGTFSVIFKHDIQGIYSVVIGAGNKP